LTNFFNGKQKQESLESSFSKTTFRETNMALEAINVVLLVVLWVYFKDGDVH
jgi:hypothetical protein